MVTVKFLRDFRSRDTNEQFFERGQTWEASAEQAAGLVAEGAAELVGATVPALPVSAPVVNSPTTGDAPAVVKPVKKLGRPKKTKATE